MPDLALGAGGGGVIGMNVVRKSNSNGLLLLEDLCISHADYRLPTYTKK